MEWNFFTAQKLAVIDREIGVNNFTLAEYEIVRRVIYYTADFEYKSLLNFSQKPIKNGASALVCRSSIIVDVPMVQAGIMTSLAKTFSNPIYCLQDINSSLPPKNKKSWALYTLLKRYPGAICIIGQNQFMLTALLELLDSENIQPSLIIATPPIFLHFKTIKHKFNNCFVPNIRINNSKGGVNVAVAIFNSLVDLAWLAYEEKFHNESFH
jgi:precorrin-8X/cobalt-precorrin-8 methylmutase